MSGRDKPVTSDEFAAALTKLGGARRYIVAVSGGPDSMALARLSASLASPRDILAVTVDHGLRPAARAEAETAGRWCRAAGLDHRILTWEGDKPNAALQANARSARYRLLAGLAAQEGYEAILTAHNADDQAETVFMRFARGAGPSGLAAMEGRMLIASGADDPVRLLRPLLGVSRARLVATLESFAQDSIADPSNDDQGFERVRTRALLAALEEQDLLTRDALCRTAPRMQAAARRLAAEDAETFARAGGCFHRFGWASFDVWEAASASLTARLVRAIGAGDHAPDEAEAAAALEAVAASGAATLGGAMFRREGGRLYIFREPAALLGRAGVAPLAPVEIAPAGRVLWDRRFIIENTGDRPIRVAPLGNIGARARSLYGAPPEALAASPGVFADAAESPKTVDQTPDLRAFSLLEERFSGSVLRFS